MRKTVYDYDKARLKEILEYYRGGFSIKDIAELTNLTYYEVIYLLNKTVSDLDIPSNYIYEEIPDKHILIVADTHVGSYKENQDYIKEAYRIAKSKGIKTAVHAGDLIQSTFSNVQKKYTNEDRQIEYLLSTYPTGLDNYILLGNHDLNTVKKDGHYLEMMGSRDDFHIMGIKTSYLNWQGHPISLYHRCDKYRMPIESLKTVLNLKGHSHTLKWSQSGTISVPSLSDDMFEHNCSLPGFLIGNLEDDCITIDSYYYYKDSLRERPKILTKRIWQLESYMVMTIRQKMDLQ